MRDDVVMFSGGIGSWAAARRAADRRRSEGLGLDRLWLLFTDTLVEDPDLYRFLDAAAANVGGRLVKISDGRTPFDVFHDERWLGNSRVAACSKLLKQVPARRWLDENFDPATTTIHVGIDWTEIHRMGAVHASYAHRPSGCADKRLCSGLFGPEGRAAGPGCRGLLAEPWQVSAPLTEPPLVAKGQLLDDLAAEGIEVPSMYREGFPHNNCGMQGCVKGGQDYWRHLLRVRPSVFLDTEAREAKIADELGNPDLTILTESVRGERRRLPLTTLRARSEAQPELFDGMDWGGCGCFVEE